LAIDNIRPACDGCNPFAGEREIISGTPSTRTARRRARWAAFRQRFLKEMERWYGPDNKQRTPFVQLTGRLTRELSQGFGEVDPAFVEGTSDHRPVDASGRQLAQVVHRGDASGGHQLGVRGLAADRFE